MKTKKLNFILLAFLFTFTSCNNDVINPQQEVENKNFDVFVNTISEITQTNEDQYQIDKLEDFDFRKKSIINGYTDKTTRTKNKEYLFFKNKFNKNETVALCINEKNGVEKSAIFKYRIEKNLITITAYDLDRRRLFDIQIDTNKHTGILTKVYTPDIKTRINGCNAAIYAAGTPWTVGFGMVNPIAGLVAGTFFWALENAIC